MAGDVFEDGDRNSPGKIEDERRQQNIKWKAVLEEMKRNFTYQLVLEEMKRNKMFLTNRYLKEFEPSLLHEMPIRIKRSGRTVCTDKQIKGFVEKLVIVWDVIVVVGVLTCLVHSLKKMWPTEAHLKYASKYVYEYYPFLSLVCLNFAYQYGAAVFSFCNFVCKAIFRFKVADKLVKSTTPEPPTPEPTTPEYIVDGSKCVPPFAPETQCVRN